MRPTVVLNGELRLTDDALVPVSGALASFGEGALEVFRTTAHGPFLASRHLARLTWTCERLNIPAVGVERELVQDLDVLSAGGDGPWRVRLVRGRALGGGAMRALIAEAFVPSPLLRAGARLTLHEGIVTPLGMKTTSYVASRVLRRDALEAGFDECLLYLGDDLLEGASSNIVLVKNGVLVSPTSPWILEGVTLQRVVELAGELGFQTERRRVLLSELSSADEVFMTSAIRGPIPVQQVDEHHFPVGRVFGALRRRYEEELDSDWGELQTHRLPGSRVSIENALAAIGDFTGETLRWQEETFRIRWCLEGAELQLAPPVPHGGPKLRNLMKALRDEHR